MPSITLAQISWSTPDGRRVLSDLNLNFLSECTGIVGRNGVGKSTLLRLLADELSPAAGSVAIDGSVAEGEEDIAPEAENDDEEIAPEADAEDEDDAAEDEE